MARAGVPQVVAPLFSDQFYWASRVCALEIGASVAGPLTPESLTSALSAALAPSVAWRAKKLASQLEPDGATIAARRLVSV